MGFLEKIYDNSPIFRRISPLARLDMAFKHRVHMASFRRDVDAYITEDEPISAALRELIPGKPVYTVSNSCNPVFDRREEWRAHPLPPFDGVTLLTGSADYPHENLGIIPQAFRRLGITIERVGDSIHIPEHQHYEVSSFMDGSTMAIADAPWPGLTPDLLSIMLVVATQAKGSVLIHQKMFESRLFFVDKLIDMGAQIILCDPHRAVVVGHDNQMKLHGSKMSSPDIRAGIALLIAAMSANGVSMISNIEQIDRGYEDIEGRLTALGAAIKRIQ